MTIETVTKFRTDDGQEFDSEAGAIAHEKEADLRNALLNLGPSPSTPYPDNFIITINQVKDEVLEYLTGEDLPQPHPAPTFGYRDGDSIEPVHPILFRGEVIRQPEDAWNACRQYVVELLGESMENAGSPGARNTVVWVRHYVNEKTKLDEELKNAETSS